MGDVQRHVIAREDDQAFGVTFPGAEDGRAQVPTNSRVALESTKLSWMAAIIDLKGKIVRKNNKQRVTPQVVLFVDSKHEFIINTFSAVTGTAPAFRPAVVKDWMRRGCVEHCPESHIHVETELQMPAVARWSITGAGVAIVIYNLLPYLQSSTAWFALILETMAGTPLTGRGSGATLAQIHRLYALGWDLPPQFETVVRTSGAAIEPGWPEG